MIGRSQVKRFQHQNGVRKVYQHLESRTVVCTGTYRYVPVRTMLWYEKQVKSMYQYVLVHNFLLIFQKVYTGTY